MTPSPYTCRPPSTTRTRTRGCRSRRGTELLRKICSTRFPRRPVNVSAFLVTPRAWPPPPSLAPRLASCGARLRAKRFFNDFALAAFALADGTRSGEVRVPPQLARCAPSVLLAVRRCLFQ
jgi:hypothetical protein